MSALTKGSFMKKIDIYWFSGTGNTLLLAIELEKYFIEKGKDVRFLPIENAKPEKIDPEAVLGIVAAVAEQGTFSIVWKFLDSLPDVKGTGAFFLDSLGYYSGGILGPVKKILKNKGFNALGAKEVLMPNNFYKKKSKPEKEQLLRDKGIKQVYKFADKILNNKGVWFDIPVYSTLMSLLSTSDKADSFYRKVIPVTINETKCTSCNLCVDLCPVGHLSRIEGGIPSVTGGTCIHCLRCYAYCPVQAITIGNKKNIPYHAVPVSLLLKNKKKKQDSQV